MSTTGKCPQCGTAVQSSTAEGLCPACLLKRGLAFTVPGADERSPVTGQPTLRYFGDYELERVIARGGMGVVYLARQAKLNRPVAVKMILAGTLADEEAVRRFHTEAEAAANLQHPNIVAIHEIGEHEGQHYFSMDYVEGKNLAELCDGKPLSAARAAGILKTMAEAIHYAHQRGTFHRDLKPSNVLVDAAGQPHITDFGLAKLVHREVGLTRTGAVMGTANYMPPEQAAGRQDQMGPQSDVYALGAILYELLAGRPPFAADSVQATLLKVVNDEPAPPRKLNASVPADLETICLKCLEKSPLLRYASARELAEDLGRFLKQEPILARPISTSRRAEQWMKKRPLFLAAVAALALLGVSALAYGLWQQNQYLVWHAAHADAARVAGPRTAQVRALEGWAGGLCVAGMWAFLLFNKKLRGLPLRKLFDAHWMMTRPVAPMSERALRVHEGLGLAMLAFGFYYLAQLIEAVVWEAYGRQLAVGSIYALFYFGGALLLIARRERRAQLFGRPADALGAGQVAPETTARVLALLRDGLTADAIILYRGETGCSPRDALYALDRIARQAGMPGLPPARISVGKFLRNLAATLVLLAAVTPFVSPAWRLPLLLQFSGGWVFMTVIMTGLHYTGFARRWLPIALSLFYYMMTTEWQRSHFPDQPAGWIAFVGMFAGAALVIGAHKRLRPAAPGEAPPGG